MKLPDFSKLFEDGREVASADFGRVVLRRHAAGELLLTTGHVVACDPAVAPETEPFAVALPPGRHPVSLGVAHFDDGDQRVAGAVVVAGEGRAVRWELALLPGESAEALGAGEIYGYGVDSATGCFMDEEAAAMLSAAMDEDEGVYEVIADALGETYVNTWSWANVVLDPESGLNVVAFSTGMGDGLYATYAGFDAGGRVVALVTDFGLFEHEELD